MFLAKMLWLRPLILFPLALNQQFTSNQESTTLTRAQAFEKKNKARISAFQGGPQNRKHEATAEQ